MYHFFTQLLQPLPILFLLAMLALANLWRKRVETRRRLLLVVVPVVGLWTASMPAVAYLAIGSLEWQYPPLNERPDDAMAIVVLAGDVRPADDGRLEAELGPHTVSRCLHAARLYHQGEPCLVVPSGGKVDPSAAHPPMAEMMRRFLRRQGVAEADLLPEDRSRTTHENALETCRLLKEREIEKVVLVTEATHMPRSQRCFLAQGIGVVPSGCNYRNRGFRWSLCGFLPSPHAAVRTHQAFHEWLGLTWYWLRGRT